MHSIHHLEKITYEKDRLTVREITRVEDYIIHVEAAHVCTRGHVHMPLDTITYHHKL